MSDRHIRGKVSLAGRVFIISLLLLVIPLLLYSIFLYRDEYEKELTNVKLTIQVIGESQKALLEERMALQWKFLDAIGKSAPGRAHVFGAIEGPLPKGYQDHFAYIEKRTQTLWVGKEMPFHRALLMTTPMERIQELLTHFENAPFPISLALVDTKGEEIIGTQEEGVMENLPIQDTDFSLVLSVPIQSIQKGYIQSQIYRFIILIFFIGAIGGTLVWLLTRRVAKPLFSLCTVMERVSQGSLHVRYKPDRMGFEINQLGQEFNQMLDDLEENLKTIEQEKMHRERLAQELRIAREIQEGLFPKGLPQIKGIDLYPGFLPAKEVGGDFYDFILLKSGKIFLVIADTAGKGLPACLYSLGLRSTLRSLAEMDLPIDEVILKANDSLFSDVKNTGMFTTVWAGIYDPKTHRLSYCCQGHPPPLLVRRGAIFELTTGGIALGAEIFDAVLKKEETLLPGDQLLLYTDGIIEAHDRNKKLYGLKRLKDFLLEQKNISSKQVVQNLFEEVKKYAEEEPQYDDIALISIRFILAK